MTDTSLIPAGVSTPVLTRLAGIAAQPAVRRSLPVIGAIAAMALAFLLWSLISAPAQRPLFATLDEADKSAVASALDSAAIAYKLDPDTGALTVGGGDYHRARMALAASGLPKAAPDAGAALDSLPMGASRAVEGERLRGSREADLARTIEAIDAVETAKVHLAIAEPSLFVRDQPRAAASVMVTLGRGRTLADAQVQAIVHLVASSVSGLSADAVAVVDQGGHLLSRDLSDPLAAEAARQIEVQAAVERRYRDALARLLTPMLGVEGFTAEVHADLSFDEKQATRESYAHPDDAALLDDVGLSVCADCAMPRGTLALRERDREVEDGVAPARARLADLIAALGL